MGAPPRTRTMVYAQNTELPSKAFWKGVKSTGVAGLKIGAVGAVSHVASIMAPPAAPWIEGGHYLLAAHDAYEAKNACSQAYKNQANQRYFENIIDGGDMMGE